MIAYFCFKKFVAVTRIHPNANDRHASDWGSNYNPILARSLGCQLTTLHFQTYDSNLAINDGFYRQAGGAGYVPKASWLLTGEKRPPPIRLKIRILSGSCIPKPTVIDKDSPVDAAVDIPCVHLQLHDVILRQGSQETFEITSHKVPCINGNGYCPIFEDIGKQFVVEMPDVAMLVFRVEDAEKGKTLATTAVPVNCLRRGYRSGKIFNACIQHVYHN